MANHRHQRLEAAIRRRDDADRRLQQIQGRLEAARDRVKAVESECSERGVAPEKLDQAIDRLEKRFDTALGQFEQDIARTEAALAPFAKEQ